MENTNLVTRDIIKSDLADMGISEGDTVFFHSSLKSIGRVESGPDTVIDAFLELLGKNGTLVLPALCMYDWQNMDIEAISKAWDINNTPTFTGLIPETFRKRPGIIRSDNPTHSVTATGRLASFITQDHINAYGAEWAVNRPHWASKGAFGKNSPWDKLYDIDAKYMLIGVDFNSCTIIHHVQVLYLEKCLKEQNERREWPVFSFPEMGERLKESGIVKYGKIGNAAVMIMSSRDIVDTALQVLLDGGP